MTAITTEQARRGAGTTRRARAGFAGTLRSEFTKIRSVRSTYWALALMVGASLAVTITFCAYTADHWPQARSSGFDPTAYSVVWLAVAGQLVIVVLGALTITSEYSTQAIRTSLTVMPRRGVLYAAKGTVFGAVTAAVAFPASFLAFFVGQWILASTHAGATLSQPNVLRAIILTASFVVLSGLFAFGVGAVLRSTAGAISAVIGFMFLLPEIAKSFPETWYDDAIRWLPGGQFIAEIANTGSQPIGPHLFGPLGELAVLGGYTVVALIAGAVALRRRDA
jgi:hypothetical protein